MVQRSTPVIVLAAGGSSRLGRPKQLLAIGSVTLLERSLQSATAVSPLDTFLVLGSSADEIRTAIPGYPLYLVVNEQWAEGIASSIRAGLDAVLSQDDPEQVIIMVVDQPFLSAAHLRQLTGLAGRSESGIIASAYKQTAGTPVLFKRRYFNDLLNLQGDNGARKLFEKYSGDLQTVPFKNGEIDIDTASDYEKLKQNDH